MRAKTTAASSSQETAVQSRSAAAKPLTDTPTLPPASSARRDGHADLFADVTTTTGRQHHTRELRHGLVAIVITKGEQALIDAGILPDPVTGQTLRRARC